MVVDFNPAVHVGDHTEKIIEIVVPDGGNFNIQVGIKDDEYSYINIETSIDLDTLNFDISTAENAQAALENIDAAMATVTGKQTELGAMSNRITSAIDYQMIQRNSNISTLSLIKEADFAQESSNYIKAQILQQTTASLLATANQNPSIALMLISNPTASRY